MRTLDRSLVKHCVAFGLHDWRLEDGVRLGGTTVYILLSLDSHGVRLDV
jgi:hypothetical protein